MRSHSFFQSFVSASVLLSGAVASVTSPPRVTTVVIESTTTTCPSPSTPPPPCSTDTEGPRTRTKTATVTIKPPPGYTNTHSFPSGTKTWTSVTVTVKPPGPSGTNHPTPPSCNDYWLDNVKHQGLAPFADSGYKVFRNVKDYGAKGDGKADDTAAINKAISDGNRCGPGCTGSTTTPALVYFPPGTYIVSAPIIDYYYTQIIGNPSCLPVIKASSDFDSRFFLDTNPYGSNGKLAWGATNVFFRQVANLVLDLTDVSSDLLVSAIHWPSSQATSLTNIVFKLSQETGNKHQGLFIEEGSGGYVGDLVFDGGAEALAVGNQQFTMRNLTIRNAHTAVKQIWSWGWTYQGISIDKCQVGFDFTNVDAGELKVASAVVFDSEIRNTPVGVAYGNSSVSVPAAANSIILENVRLFNVKDAVRGPTSTVLEGSSGAKTIDAWGHTLGKEAVFKPPARPASLTAGGDFYVRSKPSYAEYPASSFLSARDAGAKGDGVADDTEALNKLIAKAAAAGKIVFLDAGYYRVTSTIKIPAGSRITGEALPIILSSGPFFADASDPKPVVQVGAPGESGSIEWSNAVVSTQGAQAGAILIEYNLASPFSAPTGLWEVHVRIGGFAGSDLQLEQCAKTPEIPITKDNIPTQCISGFLSFHVTKGASGLLMENCWVWVADHDLEVGADNKQISIFAGRGLLIESEKGGIWLYGTGVEHHQLYEYQLVNTKDVIMGQIQTESAYYQPNPDATIPFAALPEWYDPVFKTGESGWGLRVVDSDGILVYGAGLYSFFDNYNVSCAQIGVKAEDKCQKRIFSVEDSEINVYNLNTVGTHMMITQDGKDLNEFSDFINGFVQTILVYRYGVTDKETK
ncbi:pectate lyase superfamily protein-domain-containing protein [Podospora aff. communis PSN243]|uniref:Pectate lyase superfamily protein-domain-containing protein n=1 Tax=Podospora aff. communis PSN243 TaxID=3040156 RepID=A0AAV9G450_9PEZI|nr:pectate lyase superfamily protein-domain-containing protein [Podospora aff. communis PSN243]